MGRKLALAYQGQTHEVELESVDRRKLYGWREVEAVDENGLACERVALDEAHQLILPKGGIASAYLSTEGQWLSRDDLTPVDLAGDFVESVPSSFETGLDLSVEATAEELLLTDVRLLYQLTPLEEFPKPLADALEQGTIFTCMFSYRGGISPDRAFILRGDDGTTFLLAGQPAEVDFNWKSPGSVN